MVPGGRDRRAHRRRPHPGAAHHAGAADAAQREQAAAGPAAADAVAAPLQLPRAPHKEGPRGQAGPGVHGAGVGPRELLPDLRQDETGRPGQRQDPVSGALGDVQRPRQAGVRMTSCLELCDCNTGQDCHPETGLTLKKKDIPEFSTHQTIGLSFLFSSNGDEMRLM